MNNTISATSGIRVDNVVKEYNLERSCLQVLRGVSLDVQEGDVVSIMGASGAGKSTLLHSMGGLDKPSSGNVFLGVENIYNISDARRNHLRGNIFGFVFQAFHLLPELDVLENVTLPAMSMRGAIKKLDDIHARGKDLLRQVGLDGRMNHKPLELSGGEQQRVAIARSLMNSPRFILADEPTGNLDSKTGQHVFDMLFKLAAAEKAALVVVTHNNEVAKLCERQFILKDGILHDHRV